MSQGKPAHSETELTVALKELVGLGVETKGRSQKDVTKFLEELKDFVSESAEEIASAYLKEALKQSLSELTAEIGAKVAGLAIKHFTVILLTVFFEQTDRNLKSTQKWLFLSALNSGTASALQALNTICTSEEDLDLRNHLLKTSITQLNEAYEMSKRDPRILLCVRLLQGLASEVLGAHGFTRLYLSECLPQFRDRYLHFQSESEKRAREARDYAKRVVEIRKEMAYHPSRKWTHKPPDTRGDLEFGFETQEQAIERFNDSSNPVKYIEDPEVVAEYALHYRDWSERHRKQMEFYGVLIQLASTAGA